MMDPDTFLTTLYVMIDDFCQSQGFQEKHRPGSAILDHEGGYVFGHSSLAGKTGIYVEEEQKAGRGR